MTTEHLEEDKLFKDIGIEPLSAKFNAAYLAKVLDGKKTPIKSALLDQRLIAGLGNIYVCEALFRAAFRPSGWRARSRRNAGAAGDRDQDSLKDAIAAGGSTLRDHAQATGDPGNFQHHFPGLWPRGKTVQTGLQRHRQAHRASGPLHFLLSQMPDVRHHEDYQD